MRKTNARKYRSREIFEEDRNELLTALPVDIDDEILREKVLNRMIQTVKKKIAFKDQQVVFYKSEVEFLRSLSAAASPITIRFFACLFVARKLRYHQSQRLYYYQLTHYTHKHRLKQIAEINDGFVFSNDDIHEAFEYGFDLRISGSKMPMNTMLDPDILVYGETNEDYDDEVAIETTVGEAIPRVLKEVYGDEE